MMRVFSLTRCASVRVAILVAALLLVSCGDSSENNVNNANNSNNANNVNNVSNNANNVNNVNNGDAVPTSSDALFAWLGDTPYSGWTAEPAIHDSLGPHFGNVLTYLNDDLEASMRAGDTEHPVGSAAVKELFRDDETLDGWSVMVKVSGGTGGDTWYWYETTNMSSNAPIAEGVGSGVCTGCHGQGIDFVRTPIGDF